MLTVVLSQIKDERRTRRYKRPTASPNPYMIAYLQYLAVQQPCGV